MSFAADKELKTPIKDKPLPLPGGSLRGELMDVLGNLFGWWMIAWVMFAGVLVEWIHYLRLCDPRPITFTVIFLFVALIAFAKIRAKFRYAQDLVLGLDGERAVADALNELRELGYRVYHDLQEDCYNIDHVLIGPDGVFAIETKTRRKRGNQSVVFDGENVLVAGHKPDRDPIAQAQASAKRVRDILKQQSGRDVWVKPVLLFPGWYVEIRKRVTDLFIGNEKWFLKSFKYEHSKSIYSRDEVEELSRAMERHLRR